MGSIIIHTKTGILDLSLMSDLVLITKAEHRKDINSVDQINLSLESENPLDFGVQDHIIHEGRKYKLNIVPKVSKQGNNNFSYDVVFEAAQYDLIRKKMFNYDAGGFKNTLDFPLIGPIETHLTMLINNANREKDPSDTTWALGSYPVGTEQKTLNYSNENCLQVLQKICSKDGGFGIEFKITENILTNTNTLHIEDIGTVLPYTFSYGMGEGLYKLERALASQGIITKLFVFGSSENIPLNYRDFSEKLRMPVTQGDSISDPALIDAFGLVEESIDFDDIKPTFTGIVTSVEPTVNLTGQTIFKSNSMDFDLNEKKADGSTKYLIAGTPAKINIKKGNLAGYDFEISSYDHATKTFKINPFTDSRGLVFPGVEPGSIFKLNPGDEFTLIDIIMPQSYIDVAEAKLLAKGIESFGEVSKDKVKYTLDLDPLYFQNLGSEDTIFLNVGDHVRLLDNDLNIDKTSRIISLTRDLLNLYKYNIEISDTYEVSIVQSILTNIDVIKTQVLSLDVKNKESVLSGFQRLAILKELIFDTDGYLDPGIIKPESIETSMISVGSRSQQLNLEGVIFTTNLNSNVNALEISNGVLNHFSIDPTGIKSWDLLGLSTSSLVGSKSYYIYAKVLRTGSSGSFLVTTEKIKYDSEIDYFNFLLAVLYIPQNGMRLMERLYGSSYIQGREITSGRVSSIDKKTYFDLDTGVINGKIVFKNSTGNYQDVGEVIDVIDNQLESLNQTRDYVETTLQTDLSDLKNRADGVIESWFYSHSPSLSNLPASNWTTNEQKDSHIGDTFTNMQEFVDNTTTPDAGKAWRFARNADNSYSWNLIANSDSTKALIEAGKAKDTADSKRRVFIAQPFPPYDLGDLWSQGTSGDLMRCKFARTSGVYVATDWEKASKYTDDTRAIQAETAAKEYTDGIKVQIDDELSDLATEITNLSDAVTDLPIGALTDTVLFGIKQQKNSVQSEYQDVYSRYLIIRDDAALLNKLPVTDAFASYYNAYNSLISYFDSAFNDSAITQAEKDELTARFTAYKNQVSLFATALQNAVQAIQEQKIDNIQIGGRNYFKKDQPIYPYGGLTIEKYGVRLPEGLFIVGTIDRLGEFRIHNVIKSNGWWTISWDMSGSQNTPVEVYVDICDSNTNSFVTTGDNTWKRFSLSVNVTNYGDGSVYNFVDFQNFAWAYFFIKNIKVEKGNKATDHTVAPEDVIAEIETAKTAATQAAKTYSDAQDLVKETTTKAYADGIVTAAEQRSINDATNKANAAKTYADAQDVNLKILIDAQTDGKISALETELINSSGTNLEAAKLYADAQAVAAREAAKAWADGEITAEEQARIAQADANLTNAKNYAEAQDALLKTQQQAYADNKVSVSEQAAINVAKAYADQQRIIAEAYADGIVDEEEQARLNQALLNLNEAKAHADAAVDNIEIGGRNLLYENLFEIGHWGDGGEQIPGHHRTKTKFKAGTYTIATKNYVGSGNAVFLSTNQDAIVIASNTTKTFTFLVDFNLYIQNIELDAFLQTSKLEKGNKATDWTPAPEDIDAEFVLVKSEINDVDNKLTNLQTNFTDFASDGVINIAEAKALKNIAQTLNNEKGDVNQKYLQAYNDSNLIDKTPLQTAWNNYDSNHDTLLNYINTYTAGNRAISPAELVNVNNAFTNYRNTLSALSAALETALKAIADRKINVVQVDATAAKAQAQNAQNTAAAAAAVTSFLNTDVNGNVVSTGTLQVGSVAGANAGITGVVDKPNSQSVRLWAGAPYAGKETAPWNVRENGFMTFNHPNGNVAFEFGLENGKFVMNGYHESGSKMFQLSPNRGLVNVAYVPEDWFTTYMIKINQSSSTLNTSLAENFIVNLMTYTVTGDTTATGEQFYAYSISPNFSSFEYSAGTHPDNLQYEVLNGYKDTNQSRVSNIADGWYSLNYGELGYNFGYVRPIFNHAYVLYYIQGGKVTKTQIVNIQY